MNLFRQSTLRCTCQGHQRSNETASTNERSEEMNGTAGDGVSVVQVLPTTGGPNSPISVIKARAQRALPHQKNTHLLPHHYQYQQDHHHRKAQVSVHFISATSSRKRRSRTQSSTYSSTGTITAARPSVGHTCMASEQADRDRWQGQRRKREQ